MKKNGHRLLTLAALVGTAAGVIHIANRFIDATSQLKDMLEQPHGKTYDWRFGKIHYTKQGHGSPLLLVHDIMPGASGYEWNAVENQLATEHTVYTIDLLGCGRSEKVEITYTNFVFVQLLCDFVKNVIHEETDIIASGFSGSFAIMAYRNNSDYIRKIMLVNPPSLSSLKQAPCEDNKLFKHIIELPVFGTLIYHIACAREAISSMFMEQLFYNPFHVTDTLVDTYYESAHKGGSNAKYLYSSYIGKYLNISINNAVESSDACIYIISGKKEASGSLIAEEYQKLNSSIETATIPDTRHLPHIEDPEHFLEQVSIFL